MIKRTILDQRNIKNKIKKTQLIQQAKYHSFIVCQTKSLQLSQKFPYHVTTLKGQFVSANQKQLPYTSYQYNFTFDCVNYLYNGKNLILSQGEWIKNILNNQQRNLLQNDEIIPYRKLKSKDHFKFYFYHLNKQLFIEIVPQFILKQDCIIFQQIQHILNVNKNNNNEHIQFIQIEQNQIEQALKKMKNQSSSQSHHQNDILTFRCEYAIMSDSHFLGNFVTGYKPICSYLKMGTNDKGDVCYYYRFINQKILSTLKKLFPKSAL